MTDTVRFTAEPPVWTLYDPERQGDERFFLSPYNGEPFWTYHKQIAELYRLRYGEHWQVVQMTDLLLYLMPRQIPAYAQRDPEWKDVGLGFGTSTIGSYGCLVTCVAMAASHAAGAEITPPMANDALKAVDGFTGANKNLMYFAKVVEAFPFLEMAGLYRYPYPQDADVTKIDQALSKGQYPIVQVDMDPQDSDLDEHWVLVIGSPQSGEYIINDPWTGKRHELPPAYCKAGWQAKHAIFSIAVYARKA